MGYTLQTTTLMQRKVYYTVSINKTNINKFQIRDLESRGKNYDEKNDE